MGSFVTAFVSLFLDRKAGDETIPVISPFGGCAQYTPMTGGRCKSQGYNYLSTRTSRNWSLLLHGGGFAGDTTIFFLTLYKAFTIGTMYFSALSLMNLGNTMTLLFAPVRCHAHF
ncbi:hypothetical protein BGY98DRAFT_152855 [Russula aff. rugulosa BPL654]|nr:hypothetical protein BGY98DRAFT_152855 [Russula aff. rugulosa BPL654]